MIYELTEKAKIAIEHWNDTKNSSDVLQAFCSTYHIPSDEIVQPDYSEDTSAYAASVMFSPNSAYRSECNEYDGELCFCGSILYDMCKLEDGRMCFGFDGCEEKPRFYLATICCGNWEDYLDVIANDVVQLVDNDFAKYVKWYLESECNDLAGTISVVCDGNAAKWWNKEYKVTHEQVLNASSLTRLLNDCIEAEKQKESGLSADSLYKPKHKPSDRER